MERRLTKGSSRPSWLESPSAEGQAGGVAGSSPARGAGGAPAVREGRRPLGGWQTSRRERPSGTGSKTLGARTARERLPQPRERRARYSAGS